MSPRPSGSAFDPLAVKCATCEAPRRAPCVRVMGPDKGKALSTVHYVRKEDSMRRAQLQTCPTCYGKGVVR